MDAADAFWAASIASRFTDEAIDAIVKAGRLSDAGAARFLTDVIIRRRDKVVAYWIGQTNPLDGFAASRTASGRQLTFDNAAIRVRVAEPGASYETRWFALDNMAGTEQAAGTESAQPDPRLVIPDTAWGRPDDAGFRYAIASIRTIHPRFPSWTSPVRVTIRVRNGELDVVGIERPTGSDEQ